MNTAKWFTTSSSSLGSSADRGTFSKTANINSEAEAEAGLITRSPGAQPARPEERSGLITRVRYQDPRFSWSLTDSITLLCWYWPAKLQGLGPSALLLSSLSPVLQQLLSCSHHITSHHITTSHHHDESQWSGVRVMPGPGVRQSWLLHQPDQHGQETVQRLHGWQAGRFAEN